MRPGCSVYIAIRYAAFICGILSGEKKQEKERTPQEHQVSLKMAAVLLTGHLNFRNYT